MSCPSSVPPLFQRFDEPFFKYALCVLLITRLLREMEKLVRTPVNNTSWVAIVTPTDRPKSVRNRCVIELFGGVLSHFPSDIFFSY